MFISTLLLLLLTAGGLGLTYLFADDDESFLWRVCAGNVVGSALFGLVCFLIACAFGFTPLTVAVSYLLTLLPVAVFSRSPFREKFAADWQKAKAKLEDADFDKFLRFAYYFFFVLLFWLFFQRAMMETADGIYIGSSHNYGDLPFHLGAIFSFKDGQNFPPENPSFAFAKFTYPFMADLIVASLAEFGARVSDAMLAQNVFFGFSLLVLLERFVFKLTGNRLAGKIAPVLLFFCGGVGFLWFFQEAFKSPGGFYKFLWNIPIDYTIRQEKFNWGTSQYAFRWGNSLTSLFLTQRSLLFGMPLTIIALQKVWQIFSRQSAASSQQSAVENQQLSASEKPLITKGEKPLFTLHSLLSTFLIGLLAGTLPLVHTHSLAVLFIVCAFLFFFSAERWREWIAFGVGVSIIAIPELLWAMSGSATRFDVFVDWHPGWVIETENFAAFWVRNVGLFIPLLALGIYFVARGDADKEHSDAGAETPKREGAATKVKEQKTRYKEHHAAKNEQSTTADEQPTTNVEQPAKNYGRGMKLLLFYVPFLLCFIIPNLVRLAPWDWDNIKVLIYWFVGSLPFVALFLARLWQEKGLSRIFAAVCLIALTAAGAADVWRVVSRTINSRVFENDSIKIAEQINQKTPVGSLFLNAPIFNTALALTGRRSLMRFTGHLSSYGIDYAPRETELKQMFQGSADLLEKNHIDYVLVSPEEREYFKSNNIQFNEEYFRQFPVVAEVGQYKVYKLKK